MKPDKRPYALHLRLMLLLGTQLCFALIIWFSGFAGASGDDFFRALVTYEWRQAPFFVTSAFNNISILWFPTHFWITGLVYMLTGRLVFAMTLVSILSASVALFFLFHLAKILFNQRTGFLAVALVGFLPWYLWLGISMTEMSLYYMAIFGAFFFFCRWKAEQRDTDLIWGALMLLLATMLRPEGWIFAGIIVSYLFIYLLTQRPYRKRTLHILASINIIWLFIAFWLLRNYWDYGDPFFFLQTSKQVTQSHMAVSSISGWIKGLSYPFIMFIISPLLFLLTAASIFFSLRRLNPVQKLFLCAVLLQLGVMIIASIYGAGTRAVPQRYVLVNLALLSIFLAASFDNLWIRSNRKYAVFACLIVLLGFHGAKSFAYPTIYQDTIAAGKVLKDAFESGEIDPKANVCTDLAFSHFSGHPFLDETERLITLSSHAALQVYSGRPKNLTLDALDLPPDIRIKQTGRDTHREQTVPAPVDFQLIEKKLSDYKVSRLLIGRRGLMDLIPPSYILESVVKRFGVFVLKDKAPRTGKIDLQTDTHIREIGRIMQPGILLKGYRFSGRLFTDRLSLIWEVEPGRLKGSKYILYLRFEYRRDQKQSFTRRIQPLINWIDRNPKHKAMTITDDIVLGIPGQKPGGDYRVTVTLAKQNSGNEVESVQLPPVTLISSKREVLIAFLKNRDRDWRLLAKTLWAL